MTRATLSLEQIRKDVEGWAGEFQVVVWQSNEQVADVTYVRGDDDYHEIAQGLDLHVAESIVNLLNAPRQLLARLDVMTNLDTRDAEIIEARSAHLRMQLEVGALREDRDAAVANLRREQDARAQLRIELDGVKRELAQARRDLARAAEAMEYDRG